ncbi:MAG: phage virion morphogenesis protein [Xanthomonadales bacterium]|nr:phage virion morphogenesis protein [Xanthomonadales bacterium]
MDDLAQLETWCAPLLAKLSSVERRKLARSIAIPLRRSQAGRIASQQNPDGSVYAPRKTSLRDKKGRIRKEMFAKLRTTKFLRTRADPNSAAVEFTGRVARIARVHQDGGEDRVARNGPRVRYQRRELLGFTAAATRLVRDLLIQHLSG